MKARIWDGKGDDEAMYYGVASALSDKGLCLHTPEYHWDGKHETGALLGKPPNAIKIKFRGRGLLKNKVDVSWYEGELSEETENTFVCALTSFALSKNYPIKIRR